MIWWEQFIGQMPFDWAHYGFMARALLGILLLAPVFALLGSMVINNQLTFFSDAIGHAALTGIAIGTILGFADPTVSMMLFAAVLTIAIFVLRRYGPSSTDTVIGIVMSFTVALGIVLLSARGGFARYTRYLVGDILSISRNDLLLLAIIGIAVIVLWIFLINRIVLVSINSSLARSRGTPVWMLECVFALITAEVVTVAIPWVGLLVVNALIVIPAAAARTIARSTTSYIWLSIAISIASGVAGLITSYYASTATGATMVLYAMGFFVLALVARAFLRGSL